MKSYTMGQQIGRHAVAIISLIVALTALLYTTWREEETEKNRTTRAAAFEILKNLGELQAIVNQSHFPSTDNKKDPLEGWGNVSMITDLVVLLPSNVMEATDNLSTTWKSDWNKIKTDESSVENISKKIDAARESILATLHRLR
jgi:hypothetical protein